MARTLPGEIVDQLRASWRSAGIAATEADLAGIIERGFLDRLLAFRAVLDGGDSETVPDYAGEIDDRRPTTDDRSGSPTPLVVGGRSSDEHTLLAIAAQLQARTVSPVELVERALAMIDERDGEQNAFQVLLNERALAAAQAAEAELAAGTYRGPLHGVPVAVKDLFDLAGTPTTAGSLIRAGRVVETSSTVVERLEAAGAIIVGKTRMSEFAYSPGSNNAHYGPTPDSGGSSSGSAAAVTTGMVYGALGSDTGGSIRIPAANCGIVGLKPTYGRISLGGAVNLSWSVDHAGPLTRTVADAAAMLAALAGPDTRDPRTAQPALPPLTNLGAGFDVSSAERVQGLRVGLLGSDGTEKLAVSDEVLGAAQRAAEALQSLGAELVPVDMPEMDALRLINGALIAMEAAAYHLRSLQTRLDEFSPFMRQRVLAAFAYGPGDFVRAQQLRRQLRQRANRLFERIDLLCAPCVPTVAPALDVPTSTNFTGPFNCLGWPALSLPGGLGENGLPLAAQFITKPWDEATLLRAAHAAESILSRLILNQA
jgi:Asp-tRNA(Asn)/Glu-tRNA(Gln) amidotransferase A subunit family amidase